METEWKCFAPFKNLIAPLGKGKLILFCSPNSLRKHKENKLYLYVVSKDYFQQVKINRAALVWFVLFVALKAIGGFIYLKEHFNSIVTTNTLRRILIPCDIMGHF